jgi:hypothetical protein
MADKKLVTVNQNIGENNSFVKQIIFMIEGENEGRSRGMGPGILLKAMEQAGAPEACTAGNAAYETILLKVLTLNIVAEGETAIKTEGEIITEHTFPEGSVIAVIPDIKDVFLLQVPETPGLDLFFPSAHITAIPVPEEVAGMHISLPRDKRAFSFNEFTLSVVSWSQFRQLHLNTFLSSCLHCLFENLFYPFQPFFIPHEKPFQMEGYPLRGSIGLHLFDEGEHPFLIGALEVFHEDLEIPAYIQSLEFCPVFPDVIHRYGSMGIGVIDRLVSP